MNVSRRTLFITAAASSLLSACGMGNSGSGTNQIRAFGDAARTAPTLPDPSTAPSLSAHFASNFKVGFAADPWITSDAASNAIVTKHGSSITAEGVMTATTMGTSAGVYDFGQADALIAYAQARGLAVRGNNLLSDDTTPSWFFDGNPADATYKSTVRARLETYVTDVVTHFKGRVSAWDVVNQAASDSASGTYRNSLWYQALGPAYIAYAFRAARAADPSAQLFLNDYWTEDSAKLGRVMAIVDSLKAGGVPIDGVGHQFHLNTSVPVSAVANALSAVANRGLINHVTQLDISLYVDPGALYAPADIGTPPELTGSALISAQYTQALQYRALYNLFVATPSVQSVTTWGTDDAHSWLNSTPVTRANYGLLFDRSGNPKSDFWAIVDSSFAP